MSGNGYDTWGPCTPAQAEALAAGMAAAEQAASTLAREGRWVEGDGTWEWEPDPMPWEQEPAYFEDAPEAVAHGQLRPLRNPDEEEIL